MNQFDNMRSAVAEAKQVINAADIMSNDMAKILEGRLRSVSPSVLSRLKKELKDFNAHTRKWK